MRTLILYDETGTIVAVYRAETLLPGLETPFGPLEPGQTVVDVSDRKSLAGLEVGEIHNGYRISVKTGKVIKKR